MPEFVAVSVWAVLLAAILSFIWGGIYFAVLAQRLGRVVGLDSDGQGRMPPQALIVAFLTRLVQAFGVAAVLAAAGVGGVAGGALGGLTSFAWEANSARKVARHLAGAGGRRHHDRPNVR